MDCCAQTSCRPIWWTDGQHGLYSTVLKEAHSTETGVTTRERDSTEEEILREKKTVPNKTKEVFSAIDKSANMKHTGCTTFFFQFFFVLNKILMLELNLFLNLQYTAFKNTEKIPLTNEMNGLIQPNAALLSCDKLPFYIRLHWSTCFDFHFQLHKPSTIYFLKLGSVSNTVCIMFYILNASFM